MKKLLRGLLLGAAVAAVSAGFAAEGRAQDYHLRISLETSPNHSRNLSIQKFVDTLNEKSGGKIKAEIFPSAQLGPDRDMAKKLATGSIDMGAVGTWLLSAVVPNADITALPAFYGRDREVLYHVTDGPVGQEINKLLEDKLRVKVVGKWLDLGFANSYTGAKQIKEYSDFQGLKFRIPGGPINIHLYETFGANPVVIPWPDLPLALIQGTVDGAQTTSESVRSAKLWDSGIKHAFEEKQILFQYVPMISGVFWNKLPKDLQKLVTDTWAARIDEMRDFAHSRQQGAREELIKNGIVFTTPTEQQIAAARKELMKDQPALVKELDMDPELVQRAMDALPKG